MDTVWDSLIPFMLVMLGTICSVTIVVRGYYWWFGRKLTPGVCECGHRRCQHAYGTGKCCVTYFADDDPTKKPTASCACQLFIYDESAGDDGGGGGIDDDVVPTPSPEELSKLVR